MRIISNMQSLFVGRSNMTKQDLSSTAATKQKTQKFDEIMLQRKEILPESQFLNEVKADLKKEISVGKSQKELEEIKLQVANGTYQIGLEDIARRILY